MNLNQIKKEIEELLKIGFILRKTTNGFVVYPVDANDDQFYVECQIKNDIRIYLKSSIQKYGANFLRLINKSDEYKRKRFIDLIQTIDVGKFEIFINGFEVGLNEFVNNDAAWKNFEVRYNKVPYENDDEIIKVLNVMISLMLSLIDYSIKGFEEGNKEQVISQKYERNPINRQICLSHKGYKCVICGFDFEKTYGEAGRKTIEVHHTVPVSSVGEHYIIDPIRELEPVCSNCHTIIHKRNPIYSIEEVKNMLKGE